MFRTFGSRRIRWAHGAAGTAPVGGAELGHISLERQRSLKSEVLAEQLKRLAGLDLTTEVEAVGDNHDGGLGWRTRASFAVTPKGRLGMHAHRSDVVLPIKEMPLALAGLNELKLWDLDLSGIARVEVAVPANGSRPLILLAPEESTSPKRLHSIVSQLPPDVSVASFDPGKGEVLQLRGRTWVQETAAGHDYRVTGEGFWQIHKDAPDTLVGAVTGYLSEGGYLQPGATVADLYAGAGLFTAPLADAVGVTGSVLSVEGAPGTSRDARKNLHGQSQVEIVQGRVERVLHQRARSFDSLVLDPPRAGAGKAVVKQLMATGPRAIAYVSCDPASFARDLGYFHLAAVGMMDQRRDAVGLVDHRLERWQPGALAGRGECAGRLGRRLAQLGPGELGQVAIEPGRIADDRQVDQPGRRQADQMRLSGRQLDRRAAARRLTASSPSRTSRLR